MYETILDNVIYWTGAMVWIFTGLAAIWYLGRCLVAWHRGPWGLRLVAYNPATIEFGVRPGSFKETYDVPRIYAVSNAKGTFMLGLTLLKRRT